MARPSSRLLTAAEQAMVAAVFGTTVRCAGVRLHRRRWWLLQPATVVMAPDGHIYFPPDSPWYRADFAEAPLALQGLFLHEMTHVWQHQTGMNLVVMRGPLARYRYLPLVPGRPFELYGIEQQADIVRDYWRLRHGQPVPGAPPLAAYERLLPFLPRS